MQKHVLLDIQKSKVTTAAKPRIINDTDVLIKIKVVGLCGSDVHYFTSGNIGSQVVDYPFAVGHEAAGVIEEVGEGVSSLKKGDRIAIEPAIACGTCDQCLAGRQNTCRNMNFLGCPGQIEGCLSEFIVMPQECCFKIPENMSYDEASISEPLAIGLYAVKRSIDLTGKSIAILGFGPIGMSVMLSALALGAKQVFVTDKLDYRLEIAKNNGALYTANPTQENIVKKLYSKIAEGVDCVFECCGKQEATNEAIEILKPGGKLMLIGIPEFTNWSFEADSFRRKEICVQNVRRQNHCVQEALDLMSSKAIDVSGMVTHRFNLSDTHEAFKMVESYSDNVMKAMIDI